MTWEQIEGNKEITEVFYQHMSDEEMEKVIPSGPTDKRQKIDAFLDQFIKTHCGSSDVLQVLQLLIIKTKKYSSFKDVQAKLEWLCYETKI